MSTANAPSPGPGVPGRQAQAAAAGDDFHGRVLLTAVAMFAVLAVVFVLVRVLTYHIFARRSGGLAASILRSMSSFGPGGGGGGIDAAVLDALPAFAYRRGGGEGAAAECAVCLAEVADGEKVRELPTCGHLFHADCVDVWLRSHATCPVCRAGAWPVEKAAAGRPWVQLELGGGSEVKDVGAASSTTCAVPGGGMEVQEREGGDLERQ